MPIIFIFQLFMLHSMCTDLKSLGDRIFALRFKSSWDVLCKAEGDLLYTVERVLKTKKQEIKYKKILELCKMIGKGMDKEEKLNYGDKQKIKCLGNWALTFLCSTSFLLHSALSICDGDKRPIQRILDEMNEPNLVLSKIRKVLESAKEPEKFFLFILFEELSDVFKTINEILLEGLASGIIRCDFLKTTLEHRKEKKIKTIEKLIGYLRENEKLLSTDSHNARCCMSRCANGRSFFRNVTGDVFCAFHYAKLYYH